jgi:hypothetical protein
MKVALTALMMAGSTADERAMWRAVLWDGLMAPTKVESLVGLKAAKKDAKMGNLLVVWRIEMMVQLMVAMKVVSWVVWMVAQKVES